MMATSYGELDKNPRMTAYRLYELNDQEFELLVGQICLRILGTGTIVFTPGKDGGRDGRFTGTAERYPSTRSPLKGKFIIQAKHTTNPSASCSDPEFKRIMKLERPRIKALVVAKELDHYLLFTNRRITGIKEASLTKDLKKLRGIKTANILAKNTIDLHLTANHRIWTDLGFDRDVMPFRFNPEDLVSVIQSFHDVMKENGSQFDSATNFTYVDKRKKNRINKLTKDYYSYILKDSLPHFDNIKRFLEDSRNETAPMPRPVRIAARVSSNIRAGSVGWSTPSCSRRWPIGSTRSCVTAIGAPSRPSPMWWRSGPAARAPDGIPPSPEPLPGFCRLRAKRAM